MRSVTVGRVKRSTRFGPSADRWRRLAALLALLCGSALPDAPCRGQSDGDSRELSTIDTQTRWTFRALSPVIVHSPIIRLGDVVEPLNPNIAAWQRLRYSPIGLVPLGGHPMTIRRDRLESAICDAEATPLNIEWLGPKTIRVVYQRAIDSDTNPPTRQVAYTAAAVQQHAAAAAMPSEPLLKIEADRILRWILLAFARQHRAIVETYQIDIDRRQPQLAQLKAIGGVTSIQLPSSIAAGDCRIHVAARSVDGPIEVDLNIRLTEHPTVAVPRRSLPRGHRIRPGDLTTSPLSSDQLEQEHVIDPNDVIGMEVRNGLRANQPFSRGDVGAPILVHRGDLIELRSIVGRIWVTTNAKALDNGSESDLIEVETMQPRKRLIARVVQPGLVEIVTRAPRVDR